MEEQDGATGPNDGAGGRDLGREAKVGQVHVITLEDGWREGDTGEGQEAEGAVGRAEGAAGAEARGGRGEGEEEKPSPRAIASGRPRRRRPRRTAEPTPGNRKWSRGT